MTKEEILAKVIELTVEKLCVDKEVVTETTNFQNDLGADSLDQIELVMDIEKAFNIAIPDDDWYKYNTVGEAVEELSKRLTD